MDARSWQKSENPGSWRRAGDRHTASTWVGRRLGRRFGQGPALFLVAFLAASLAAIVTSADGAEPVAPIGPAEWAAIRPTGVGDFAPPHRARLKQFSEHLEAWSAARVWDREQPNAEAILLAVRQLADAKRQVDQVLDATLQLRGEFVKLPASEQRAAAQGYLEFTSGMIDLSGRLRYLMRDAIDSAAFDLDPDPPNLERLVDLLIEYDVSIGGVVMTYVLFDPPADSGLHPFPRPIKVKVLKLIARTRQVDALPQLADFVRRPDTPPDLAIVAAEVIRRVGLPQDPIPGQDPTLPDPFIKAAELKAILDKLDARKFPAELQRYHRELVEWLGVRVQRGVVEDEFRVGTFQVRAGDWLLMRNPSPYNLFTDLSPGLFTHVGVVAVREHADGIRRFVIVDLPERGDHVPETNVDMYLLRTLHYFFLRHEDAGVGRRMGEVAAQLAGNESVFDLTFQTERVEQLRGKPLDEQRIHTYCAGFLLLCAQETSAPRKQFFPIEEFPAGGLCSANLQKLGLSIGENFVSPTGALFSPHLKIVGSREPMYSADREVKEFIYDYFARSMIEKPVRPSPDAAQALRLKVAQLARYNPWLARALAKANNVSEHMDLESAAKAAAAIETLDEVANGAAQQYLEAREALLAGPLDQLPPNLSKPEDVERIKAYRATHQDLFERLIGTGLTPRELRIALVEYYHQWGRERIDDRFFPPVPRADPPPGSSK